MSRRAAFKQSDVTRALRAAVAAGLKPCGFTVAPDGSFKVDCSEAAGSGPRNPLDRLLRP